MSKELGSEQHASSLIANTFWQSYVESPAFRRELRNETGLDPSVVKQYEILVVAHGGSGFSLLLTDPNLAPGEVPRRYQANPQESELRNGWNAVYSKHNLGQSPFRYHSDFPGLPFLAPPQVLKEVASNHRFSVVLTGPMQDELTHAPSPSARVGVSGGISTAGVYVQDGMQHVGVTAAEHAVPPGSIPSVDGSPGNVLSRDNLTDSCFIHVPGIIPRGRSTHGPLRLAPRQHDSVTFEGVSTGPGAAHIIAWNYELPYIDPNLQQTVRTDFITSQGDSGAALIDSADYVVGFAHSRSSPTAVATYSSWIWADAVLQKHVLTIY